jgi:hypothetical protein
MTPTVRISTAGLKAAFARFSAIDQKAILDKTVRTDAMGFVRDIIAITPPGHQGKPLVSGSKGEAAVAAGEAAIKRDLKKMAVPMTDAIMQRAALRMTQQENVLLWIDGDGTLVGVQRPFFMAQATLETLQALHQSRFLRGRMRGREIKRIRQGKWDIWQAPVVPQSVYQAFLRQQLAKVGKLAGGWAAAAQALKVRVPKIAKRHAAGTYMPIEGPASLRLRLTNTRAYATEADVERRARHVLDSDKRAKRLGIRIKEEIRAKLKAQLART